MTSTRGTRRWSVPPMVWLIAPSVIFMAALFAWPTVTGVLQAFQSDHGFTLDHVQRMMADPRFWPAVRNTVLLIVVLIPLQFVAALAMALLLHTKPRGSGFHFYV